MIGVRIRREAFNYPVVLMGRITEGNPCGLY